MEQRRIRITTGDAELIASLNDSDTADAVWSALPIEASGSKWGDEIYFRTPIAAQLEQNASDVVNRGDVAYWPPGQALCLFWGPTPASRGDEIRAASAVNVVGSIEGDPAVLDSVASGSGVTVDKS